MITEATDRTVELSWSLANDAYEQLRILYGMMLADANIVASHGNEDQAELIRTRAVEVRESAERLCRVVS